MGFRIINNDAKAPITVDSLTTEMVVDLINFYANDISPEDVECRRPVQLNISDMDYMVINKEVVAQFYEQLDFLKKCIIDIIIGNYHSGSVVDESHPEWVWGKLPANIGEVKYWTFFVVKRDFYEVGSWMYNFTEGNFDALKPFIDMAVDLIYYANGDDFDLVTRAIREAYPFIQD